MTELVAIAAVVIVAWFAAGTIWNIRIGRELMRWMQDGLPMLGQRTTVRWLGSTAVEMVIRDGKIPFAGLTLVIFFEARDTPWMWAIGRSRGRRDTLIIRGTLHKTPQVEFEALDPASWSARDARARVPREWLVRPTANGLVLHYANAATLDKAEMLLALVKSSRVRRLSLRRTVPQFQLHVSRPDRSQTARDFFEVVRSLAERATP